MKQKNNKYNEDICKIFHQEVSTKKRIGKNIFSRVSTRKGKVHSLRTPYTNMSKKQREELNGEMILMNINEIISIEDFRKKDRTTKHVLMTNWIKRYTNKTIVKQMNTNVNALYSLLSELKINIDDNNALDEKEFNDAKLNIMFYGEFMRLNSNQRNELFEHYLENYTKKELAEKWQVETSRVSNMIYAFFDEEKRLTLVKPYNNTKKSKTQKKTKDKNIEAVSEEKVSDLTESLVVNNNVEETLPTVHQKQEVLNAEELSSYVTINKKFKGADIAQKLVALSNLMLVDPDVVFHLDINISHINDESVVKLK